MFESSVHEQIKTVSRHPHAEAVVCFENTALDSSQLGKRAALIVGPGCTYKSVKACEGKWLHDLPSQRQYPQCFVRAPYAEESTLVLEHVTDSDGYCAFSGRCGEKPFTVGVDLKSTVREDLRGDLSETELDAILQQLQNETINPHYGKVIGLWLQRVQTA